MIGRCKVNCGNQFSPQGVDTANDVCYDACNILQDALMSPQLRRQIEQQNTVKVAQHAQSDASGFVWFVTLATFVAGVFYFWYYFAGSTGSAF